MIRILIIDDHGILRAGLRALVEYEADMEVVGDAANGYEAVKMIMKDDADLALLDINLPDLDGTEVIQQVRTRKSRMPILVLTMHREEYLVIKLLQLGANGLINKQGVGTELLTAIRTVARGKRYLSAEMEEKITDKWFNSPDQDLHESLSPQERTILQMIASGQTVSMIAKTLHISPSTVTTHRRRIKDKLQIEGSTGELIRYALDHGLG